MKKGMAIMLGDEAEDAGEETGSMDVEGEELRSAVKAFFSAAQAGDVDAGVKAWGRLLACKPPAEEDIGPEEKPEKSGLYE